MMKKIMLILVIALLVVPLIIMVYYAFKFNDFGFLILLIPVYLFIVEILIRVIEIIKKKWFNNEQ